MFGREAASSFLLSFLRRSILFLACRAAEIQHARWRETRRWLEVEESFECPEGKTGVEQNTPIQCLIALMKAAAPFHEWLRLPALCARQFLCVTYASANALQPRVCLCSGTKVRLPRQISGWQVNASWALRVSGIRWLQMTVFSVWIFLCTHTS